MKIIYSLFSFLLLTNNFAQIPNGQLAPTSEEEYYQGDEVGPDGLSDDSGYYLQEEEDLYGPYDEEENYPYEANEMEGIVEEEYYQED
jgi:hypothetical protein